MDNLDWLDDAYHIEYLTFEELLDRYGEMLTEEQIEILKKDYGK
jgi:predicted DNA-binding protein YlxM (UPF0122 family)